MSKNVDEKLTISMPSEEKLKLIETVQGKDESVSRFVRESIRQRIQSLKNQKQFEKDSYNFGN